MAEQCEERVGKKKRKEPDLLVFLRDTRRKFNFFSLTTSGRFHIFSWFRVTDEKY